jgi:hypothetical protein
LMASDLPHDILVRRVRRTQEEDFACCIGQSAPREARRAEGNPRPGRDGGKHFDQGFLRPCRREESAPCHLADLAWLVLILVRRRRGLVAAEIGVDAIVGLDAWTLQPDER